jgi:hypothetical protein
MTMKAKTILCAVVILACAAILLVLNASRQRDHQKEIKWVQLPFLRVSLRQ